ncbi:MAG: riboflavin synthase [bacterium]|nr:riboflavin synthase [bacterium]
MFTGLVEEYGKVVAAQPQGGGRTLTVEAERLGPELALGDSIAVNGACQTVTCLEGPRFGFFAMGETLQATTLGALLPGDTVNLERALTPAGRLGGHFVTGHVDGVGTIAEAVVEGNWRRLRISIPRELATGIVPKGSVTVDGVSLTVGPSPGADYFDIFIIPHTLEHTTLGAAKAGERVNIETDILGKYVLRFLQPAGDRDGRLLDLLQEHGFMTGERNKG